MLSAWGRIHISKGTKANFWGEQAEAIGQTVAMCRRWTVWESTSFRRGGFWEANDRDKADLETMTGLPFALAEYFTLTLDS